MDIDWHWFSLLIDQPSQMYLKVIDWLQAEITFWLIAVLGMLVVS